MVMMQAVSDPRRAIQRKTGLEPLINNLRAWFRLFWMISMAFVGEVFMRFSNVLAALINVKTFLGAWSLRFV
jgi:hypothetical protein